MKNINRRKWYNVYGEHKYFTPEYARKYEYIEQIDPPIDWFQSQIGKMRDEVINLNNKITFYCDEIERINKLNKSNTTRPVLDAFFNHSW